MLILLGSGTAVAQESFIAYEIEEGVVGNQEFGGTLGMDFDVTAHGRVTRLGVFDSGSDGLNLTITARLFNRDTQEELASLEFTPEDPGELVGGSRFKALAEPVFLAKGFHGTMSAEGYGAGEPNGNRGNAVIGGVSTNSGPDAISFVGGGRYGDPGTFPGTPDGGPANRYLAGTFEFQTALIAYDVPAGTVGNQEFSGALGHDFNVNAEILVTRLGVFDSGSDGLQLTITARIFDRETETEVTSLEFTPEDPGDLVGGSRFKDLPEPLSLPEGFHGTVSANGYGAGEPAGNQGVGPLVGLSTDDGPCSIDFVGVGRYGDAATPEAFPGSPDAGPPNRYATGTFEYEAIGVVDTGGIAYVVPEGTVGNQTTFGGSLGMDFDVVEPIEITSLGVFDSGSDGLNATITAQVFSRSSQNELARLEFPPDDAGELMGGSRFKPLDPPLALPAGFAGTVVASGYGETEPNGNGLPEPTTDHGGCLIRFVGGGRFGDPGAPGTYPGTSDAGPANRYAAGTFEFRPSEVVIEAPLPPGDVSATAGDMSVTISWSAPSEGPLIESYNVYRSASETKINVDPITATEFTLEGLVNGADVCVVVRSVGLGGFESEDSNEACATPTSGALPEGTFVAYEIPEGTVGNQNFGGSLGKHFTVNSDIIITRLGVFDSGSDGLAVPILAILFETSSQIELARIEFTPDDAGELVGGSRFKDLPVPIELPAGFEGTISASGYGDSELNGNLNLGDLPLSTDDGGCAISFGGQANGGAGAFPTNFDRTRRPHHYASGTFEYGLRPGTEPSPAGGGIAYNVPEGTEGNQNFGGALGLDFIVNAPIKVTDLGVFDDLGDGMNLTITARLFNRATQEEVMSLEFDAMDPGELVGGSRFKPLDPPLSLPAGFQGTIVGEGYGDAERNGNQGAVDLGTFTDDGGCLLSFVGGGRFGDPGTFPATADGGPADRYASGTFRFEADTDLVSQIGGDCNQSGGLEVGDITCSIHRLFPGFVLIRPSGAAPCDSETGTVALLDVNGDGVVDLSDVVYLSNALFVGGPPPAQGVGCFAIGRALGCPANVGCE